MKKYFGKFYARIRESIVERTEAVDTPHYGSWTPGAIRDLAERNACEAVFAADNQLQIDLDDYPLKKFWRLYRLARGHDLLPARTTIETWLSRNGNWHVMVTLPEPIPPRERITLQLMLGSDPVREILHTAEYRVGTGHVCLFRPRQSPEGRW